jgi:hypothetical protein
LRRIGLAAVLVAISLSFGGCQFFGKLPTLIELGTASVANPVTPDRLQKLEAGAVLVFTGLNAWRDACEAGSINTGCREQIRAVQVYTKQIPPYLGRLRAFVRQNDQVNASVVFNEVVDIIGIVKGKAAENGIVIQEPR